MAVVNLKGWGRIGTDPVVVSAVLDTADNPTLEAQVNAANGAAITITGVVITDLTVKYLDGVLVGTDPSETVTAVFAAIQPAETERLVTINTPTSLDGTIRIYGWGAIGNPGVEDAGDTADTPGAAGLVARYWNNVTWTGAEVVRQIEPQAKMVRPDEGDLPPGVDAGNMSVRWTGNITFPVTGGYKFRVDIDDDGDLYVDNKLILNVVNEVGNDQKESVTIQYTAGTPYPFWASLADGGRNNRLYDLKWWVPGTAGFVDIPASAYTQADTTPPVQAIRPDQGRYYVEYVNRYED